MSTNENINIENINKLAVIEQKLKDYILNNYDMKNSDIMLKYVHTFNTKKASDEIVASLNLSSRDVYLASIIALFHDYGRFAQAAKYNTYNDLKSFDHGDYACECLFNNNEILNFVDDLTEEELLIANIAIKNHNKYEIEPNLTDRQNLFCKIIRDADKVDIYRIIGEDPRDKSTVVGTISQEDLNTFYENKLLKKSKEYNFYQSTLLHLCLIFDLNFKQSYKIINREEYVKKYKYTIMLFATFKIDEELIKCFDYAEKYVAKQAQEV